MNINLYRNIDLRIFLLLIFSFCLFLSWLPGNAIGIEDELALIIEGIEFSESFLSNGRIELSSRLEIIDDYDKKSGAVTRSYLMNQDFIWIFKDRKWRIEQQMQDFRGEYYNIQVFDGEKKVDLFIGASAKMSTVSSSETRYVPTRYVRAYGSPGEYMLNLIPDDLTSGIASGFLSEALRNCQKIELIGTESIDGMDCSVIKFVHFMEIPEEFKNIEISEEELKISGSLWVVPSKGYRVIKSKVHGIGSQYVRIAEDLREWSEGIWLPTRGSYIRSSIIDGKVMVKVDFSINNVELKKEISEDFFQLEFPPGTAVINKTTNTVHRIPEPEKIPSEEELFKIARKAKEGKYTKVSLPSSTSPDDSNELVSRSWSRWFVGVIIFVPLVAITLIVVILLMIRRRKSESTT